MSHLVQGRFEKVAQGQIRFDQSGVGIAVGANEQLGWFRFIQAKCNLDYMFATVAQHIFGADFTFLLGPRWAESFSVPEAKSPILLPYASALCPVGSKLN